MKKKLLIYANYFYPEVASTAQLITEMCVELQKEYDVTVICAVPCYTGKIEEKYKTKKFYYDEYKDIKIVRVRVKDFEKTSKRSRIKHILSYYINAIQATKKVGKQDVVMGISQPPILGGLLVRKGKRITKGKSIYLVEDFNPEQIMAVGYSNLKPLLKLMLKVDNKSCKKSDLVITVASDMAENLKQRFKGKDLPKNVVINNWIDEKEIYPLDKNNEKIQEFRDKYNLNNKFVIMYSGNIGLYYDLENLIDVFSKFKDDKDVVFAFVGDGSVKQKLEERSKELGFENITFIPYQDKKDLIYSLNAADVHVVVNAKGIKGVSCPSKIYGVLATNVPIFGILEKGTEAWKIIKNSNCGILSETGNYEQIEENLRKVIEEKDKFIKEHETGRSYLEQNFTKDRSMEKYKLAIESVVE